MVHKIAVALLILWGALVVVTLWETWGQFAQSVHSVGGIIGGSMGFFILSGILMIPTVILGIVAFVTRPSRVIQANLSQPNICPHCGKYHQGTPAYCPNCGQKI